MQVNTGEINTHKYNHVGQLPLCISLLRFSIAAVQLVIVYARNTFIYDIRITRVNSSLDFVLPCSSFSSDLRLTFSFFFWLIYALCLNSSFVNRPRCRFWKSSESVRKQFTSLPPFKHRVCISTLRLIIMFYVSNGTVSYCRM